MRTSRTWNLYVPYPRLRVSSAPAAVHFPGLPEMRRCSAPLSSVQTFAGSKKFLDQRGKLARARRPLVTAKVQYPWATVSTGAGPIPINDRQRPPRRADDRNDQFVQADCSWINHRGAYCIPSGLKLSTGLSFDIRKR